MGIVKLNLANTLQSTQSKSLFQDVPKDGKVRVRLLPPDSGNNGNIWYLTENHFRLKAEDGERGIAVACNKRHGNGECLLCEVADNLKNSDDASERALGYGRNSIKANRSWYVQVLPITGNADDGFVAGDPKLMRLPKTAADKVNKLLAVQQENGDAMSCDPEAAQDLIITRQDTGCNITTYDAMTTGKPTSLEQYDKDWETKMMDADKVWEKLDLKIMSNEEQLVVLARSYPNLELDEYVE